MTTMHATPVVSLTLDDEYALAELCSCDVRTLRHVLQGQIVPAGQRSRVRERVAQILVSRGVLPASYAPRSISHLERIV